MRGFADSKCRLNPILHIKPATGSSCLAMCASQSKEGGKTPGAAAARRDSGDSSKPGFIRGHMFGCIGLAIGSSLKLFSVPIIIELHAKISGIIRKFSAGSSPIDVHNIGRYYEAAAAVADEFIHNNNDSEGKKSGKGGKGKKGGEGGKSDKHSVEKKKADKADKGGESARIARMAADAGILAASMGIGCFLVLDRHFMSETAFLISERVFGGAAGTAARAKLGNVAYEPAPGRTGKPGGPRIRGAKIKLAGLFSHPEFFKSME
ncbi:MAG: hypothetical protein LBU32_02180, partial [Clostridiales bacterium]|nr:hypothetical protein [Clostridiales bacterium]